MAENRYEIRTTGDPGVYEGIRDLWSVTFGDEPDFVDHVYRTFGGDIKGYAVTGEDGSVLSTLTVYRCGVIDGRAVHVMYAVCTAPGHRGQGLAAMLTKRVTEDISSAGGIVIVSPAERELEDWYGKLGFRACFFASEKAVLSPELDDEEFDDFDDFDMDFGEGEFEAARPALELKEITPETYARYREAFLDGRPHVELSGEMMDLIASETVGGRSLYTVNNGDAICAVLEADPVRVVLSELITNPVLLGISSDIDAEIASLIAQRFEAAECIYSTPGPGRCQSMAASESDEPEGAVLSDSYPEPYFGFPIY